MIIDFHTHIFPEKIAAGTVSALARASGSMPYADGTAEGLVLALDEAGADLAVNLPVLTKPSQFDSITRFGEAVNRGEIGGGRIISFGGIHPDDGDIEEKISTLADKGFLGIKIHPDYQGAFIDDERYVRIFRAAAAHDLVVVTHAGLDGAYVGEPIKCTPKRILSLLDKLGGYEKLVLAHNGGNELGCEVLKSLAGEDVYFDTGYNLSAVGRDLFVKILEKHSSKKILFATDSPWRSIRLEVERIRSFGLTADEERAILSDNAKTLLKLN